VIAAIPGELIQVAGGFVFGTFGGFVYSVVGITIGTAIAFFIARLLGFGIVRAFVDERKIGKMQTLINSPKAEAVTFFLFLLPGMPKDILVYLAGLTPMKPLQFFLITMSARIPALWASNFFGANLQKKNWLPLILVTAAVCIVFLVVLFTKDKIMAKLHHLGHHDKGDAPKP
jgi:uncharacterized membrane protein YdjX (TVP38/TMEM64 family)